MEKQESFDPKDMNVWKQVFFEKNRVGYLLLIFVKSGLQMSFSYVDIGFFPRHHV